MNTRFAARRFVASLFVSLVGLLLCASLAHAQAVAGNISGTVTDASGAAIVGAQVVVTNTGTGVALTTTSNDQGRYNAPDLVVGSYQVSASKSGFQKVVQANITLTVGSQLVVNLSLPVGRVQETVTVESNVSQVETQSTAISSLVSTTQMEDLPLNGRNFEQLISVAPGVTPAGNGTTTLYGVGPSFSIAGARTEGEDFLLDNSNMADFWDHQAGSQVLGTSLGVEGIQEFSLLTNTYSAQFGGNGSVMNAVSKSGTNALHGSAYEYLRNSALDSRSYFDLLLGAGGVYNPYKPAFRRNQFGGSLGGPITKNKLFFFVNYEGFRQALGQTAANIGLPEPYVAMGELPCSVQSPANASCPAAPSGPPGSATNPILSIPEAIGSGATGQTAAAASAITGIMSLYNRVTPPAGVPDQGGYYFTTIGATETSSENYGLGRIDYTLSSNDNIFGRYVIDQAYNLSPLTGFFGAALPYWPEVDKSRNQFLTVEERHIFSANVVNNAQFTFVRTLESSFSNSTLPAASDPLNFNPSRHEDSFVSPDFFTVGGLGSNQFVSDSIAQNKFGVGDDVAWNHGAHTLTFGADIMRVQSNVYSPFEYGGDYIFLSLQNFLEGVPVLGYAVANSPYTDNSPRYFREIDINPYFNDSWKVNSRLTLNIGVRYEYGTNPSGWPLYTVTDTPFGNGAFAHVSHVFQTSPNRKNIDPRIGLAWAPFGDQKTSIRAGYGIFHDPVAPRTYASAYYFDPPYNYHQFAFGTMTFPNAFINSPAPLPPQDVPTLCAMDNLSYNSSGCTSLGDGVPYDTYVAPYQEQWNLNVQRSLGAGTVLSVGYVGSRGVHLFSQRNLNPSMTSTSVTAGCGASIGPPFFNLLNGCSTPTGSPCVPTVGNLSSCYFGAFDPILGGVEPVLPRVNDNYAELNENVTGGRSSYNSLQVSLVRQAARGITTSISYTYSHCLDDGSGSYGLEEGALGQLDPYDPRYDYGDCAFDLRHNLVASVVYTLPFHGNRLVEGWQVSGIFSARSGSPFSISDGFDQAGLDNNVASTRPDVTPGCNPYVRKKVLGPTGIIEPEWLNTSDNNAVNDSCFTLEPVGTLGNAGRDTLFGPRFLNLDFALLKSTKITERLQMQFRAEFFNLPNRTDFGAPNASLFTSVAGGCAAGAHTCLSAAGGGDAGSTAGSTYGFIAGTAPNSQREIQFAIKLLF
jgi:Carboxypeptidase regulatory-like domain